MISRDATNFPYLEWGAVPIVMIGTLGALFTFSIAFAQSNGRLDVPKQIEPVANHDLAVEDLAITAPSTMSRVIIESIATLEDPRPFIVLQSDGTRDLCGSGVADWERQQAGIDCTKINQSHRTLSKPKVQPPQPDPLFTVRRGQAEEAFDDLGLGKDVPSTVILQK